MKRALLKDSLKEIKNTYKRFISILLMAFLGVGFFVGIRAASPDMIDTIDSYFDNQNVYDIKILSTLGLTDEDITKLSDIEGIDRVYGEYSEDILINFEDTEIVTKVLSIDEVNEVYLLEGRMPQSSNECLVENSFCVRTGKKIGDTILIEKDEDSIIKEAEVTIVGTMNSPLYVSRQRDTSKLGSGKVSYNMYLPKESFDSEIYTEIYITLANTKEMLANSKEYKDAVQEVEDKIETIKEERQTARYEEVKKEAKDKLQEAKDKLEEETLNAQTKIKEAQKEISDAEERIKEIEHPTWYILDRNSNTGYNGFMQDTKSIENLGKVFPIVFFVIATLISLTSMTRMVEEQRVQIGTMKALGYNKIQIASKYLLYASLACIIGGAIGMIIGFASLPRIIWMMYSMMYEIPNFVAAFNLYYAALGLGLASICIIGATLYTATNVLGETPSELMRPKAPKPGKRVLLERIPFIWKHLSFTKKVTVRNIFRYKKRFLMTIIGIAGCTALILTGFGIKDSISAILPNQYQKVYEYDMQINLKSGIEKNAIQEFISNLEQKEEINRVIETYMTSGTLINGENEEAVQIIVPKDEKIEEVINFADSKTKEKVSLQEGKIAITDKVAELLNVKKGDTIILKDADNIEKQIEISDVLENYIYHYVYMPRELYEELYGKYSTNVLFTQNNIEKSEEEALSKELLKEENVNSISLNSSVENVMGDMMNSLNYVVVILIVSAGLLAFVVLYNLSNVNISERIRELATIKVLGFYDKEVYEYVTRETVILTTIGIVLGLIGGYFLSFFIIKTCEINVLRFGKEIMPLSYLYAIIITLIFTMIVNVVTYFSLKKIDMIESLKSIE